MDGIKHGVPMARASAGWLSPARPASVNSTPVGSCRFDTLPFTTEGTETPVRAARKEACERIRFAQSGHTSPILNGRQMICGRRVD